MDLSLPADPLFSPASYTVEFRDRMSAHEAGHATMGLALGARIEAIYARNPQQAAKRQFSSAVLDKI